MTVLPIAAISFIMNVILLFWVLVAIALILVVLIQKGRGGGLSSAFGGGTANSLLGTKTTDWITKATIGIVLLFLLLAVVLNKYYKPTLSEQFQEPTNSATTTETTGEQGGVIPDAVPPVPEEATE